MQSINERHAQDPFGDLEFEVDLDFFRLKEIEKGFGAIIEAGLKIFGMKSKSPDELEKDRKCDGTIGKETLDGDHHTASCGDL